MARPHQPALPNPRLPCRRGCRRALISAPLRRCCCRPTAWRRWEAAQRLLLACRLRMAKPPRCSPRTSCLRAPVPAAMAAHLRPAFCPLTLAPSQVPPVLAEAASLEVLDLSSNPGLELSRHDVEATLSRMPRLSLLLLGKQAALGLPPGAAGTGSASTAGSLEWRTPSVAALVALGQALPQLQVRRCGAAAGQGIRELGGRCRVLLAARRPLLLLPSRQIDFEHTAKEYEVGTACCAPLPGWLGTLACPVATTAPDCLGSQHLSLQGI